MELYHHGIKGQKWGIRRYQNPDGSLTPEGQKRYDRDVAENNMKKKENRAVLKEGGDPERWVREDIERSKKVVDAREYNNSGKLVDGTPAEIKPENVSQAAPGITAERKATGVAKSFDKGLTGTYTVTAESGLHIRNVAGSKTGSMIVLPCGMRVQCYGYYTVVSGVKWLYIQVTYQGVKYTGFSSGEWLNKVK